MRTKLIVEPVFNTFVRLVYDASIDELYQYIKGKYNYEVGNHGDASMGKLVILGDSDQVFLWVKDNLMIEVVHETAHLVAHWMRYKGIPIDESTDEVFACLQCFYIDKIARTFDKKKRKNKGTKKGGG
jgi:hypothetical protein